MPTAEQQQQYDKIHKSLMLNGLNNELANFLAAMAMRITELEAKREAGGLDAE